jgi:multidrug efflux pump
MMQKLAQFTEIVQHDPAVAKIAAFYGSGGSYGSAFAVLKPLAERQASARQVVDRLKPQLEQIAGVALYLGGIRISGSAGERATEDTNTRYSGKTPPSSTNGPPRSQPPLKICQC